MLPYWVDAVNGTSGVMSAIYALNTSRTCTGTADSRIFPDFFPGTNTPDGEPHHRSGVTGDVIHFNATMATVMGYQYFKAYKSALKLTSVVPSDKTKACKNSSYAPLTSIQCLGATQLARRPPVWPATITAAKSCTTDLDCSLNGLCSSSGACECDAPWTGPSCGVLEYTTTPASGRSLYPDTDPRNTWNGAILHSEADGLYHLYNPIYEAGTLGGTTTMLHGTSHAIAGPYTWGTQPDITIPLLGAFDGPKSVVYQEPGSNETKYSLWLGGHVYIANSAAGPFEQLKDFSYPGQICHLFCRLAVPWSPRPARSIGRSLVTTIG